MAVFSPIDNAFSALTSADLALEELEARCCVPGRSPRMTALAESLQSVRDDLGRLSSHEDLDVEALVSKLEDVGGQVGSLQIDCCAPSRLPLYAEMLSNLNKIQRSVRIATGESMH